MASAERRRAGGKKALLLSALILLLAGALVVLIFSTEPTATRGGAVKDTAMLVQVTHAERGTFRPQMVVTGTVEPARDVALSSRVGGRVIARAPEFVPGGLVEKGETLLRIEPADYRNVLQQRKSDLSQAIADLELEMGRQNIAREEYARLFEGRPSEEARQLVLRQPQLNAVRMRVEAARAAVRQAELDLRRTTVEAPFNAQVLSREVSVGSQVSPGLTLGRLVGLDSYWVVATIPLAQRRWLSFPDASGHKRGAEVTLRNRSSWPPGAVRKGYLYRLLGELDEQTRMARVLVSVPDPLARKADAGSSTRELMLGEFLEVRIEGNELRDVVRLDRDTLRQDDTVWVMANGKLEIRDVAVVMRDAQHAYLASGLSENDAVVTSDLATVTEGAKLRLAEAAE